MRCLSALMLVLPLLASIARAEAYHVNPQGTGDYPTIQAAMDACVQGDVILLADGIYTGAGNRNIDYQGKGVTIRSESGNAEACVIDCEHVGRGFLFISLEPPEAILQDVTVTNGTGLDGGGLVCRSSSHATLRGCVFRGNYAARNGGGISCLYSAFVTATDCAFIGNSAAADGYGGGVACQDHGTVTLSRCLFSENAALWGGAIECWLWSTVKVSYCTFFRNQATAGEGGGLDCVGGCLGLVDNSTFLENSSPASGSGISATAWGGGPSTVLAVNSILAFGQGASVHTGENSTLDFACCDVFGNVGGDWVDGIAGQLGIEGNIALDPLFCGELNPMHPHTLDDRSPCAPEYNPLCGLIGAWPVGCGLQDVTQPLPSGLPGAAGLVVRARPNPFASSTHIRFAIPASEAGMPATLDVCDVTGRLVRNLLAGAQVPGVGEVTWDGRDNQGRPAAAGAYLCRLAAGRMSAREPVLLLR